MSQYKRPDEKVFARLAGVGEVNSFPDIERGWALAFEQSEGIPPMEWFNGLGRRTDESIRYLMQKGIADWSATENYPLNAYVQHKNKMWVAVRENKNEQPILSSAWVQTALTVDETKQLIPAVPVKRVNGKLGDVVLNSQDVGSFDRSKNLSDANPIEVRQNLGLGSAALRNVGTTASQLMEVGAFGLGHQQATYANVSTVNNLLHTGFYYVAASVKDLPQSSDSYLIVHAGQNSLYQDLTLAHNGEKYTRFKRGAIWSPWQSILTTANYSSVTVPVGAPIAWPSATVPAGWLKCNGASFDKNNYPLLAKAYPSGVLPDLRGEFIRGWDDGRGADVGRGILSHQSHLIAAHKHIGGWGEAYGGPFGRTNNTGHYGSNRTDGDNFLFWTNDGTPFQGDPNPNGVIGSETRPRNIAFLYIVRAA